MTRNPLLIDLAIAVVCALVVLIVSPGVAVDAILALIVLVACGVSFGLGRRRHRKRSVGRIGSGQAAPARSRRQRR